MFIPDPNFYPSRIPDLGSRIQKQQWKTFVKKKFVILPFFWVINFTKPNYFIFEMLKKKNLGQFSKKYKTFYPKKLSLSSQKYGFGIRDPRSGIRDPAKTYSGSPIPGSKRHRIPDPDPQHCKNWIKCTDEKKLIFFIKTCHLLSLDLHKRHLSYEASSTKREHPALQNMKFLNFFF